MNPHPNGSFFQPLPSGAIGALVRPSQPYTQGCISCDEGRDPFWSGDYGTGYNVDVSKVQRCEAGRCGVPPQRDVGALFTDVQLSVTGAPEFGADLIGNWTLTSNENSPLYNLRGTYAPMVSADQLDGSQQIFGGLYQSSINGVRPSYMRLTTAGL